MVQIVYPSWDKLIKFLIFVRISKIFPALKKIIKITNFVSYLILISKVNTIKISYIIWLLK